MIENLPIVAGIVGFLYTGWQDLIHGEFQAWIPYGIIIFGAGINLWVGNWIPLVIGPLFLGMGLLLTKFKKWADGDAWLFGAMGFLGMESPLFLLLRFSVITMIYVTLYMLIYHNLSKPKEYPKTIRFGPVFFAVAYTIGLVVF